MRPTFRAAITIVALVLMGLAVSTAGAVSGPGANENSKFVYTENLNTGFDLVLTTDEGSQKRFESVTYELGFTASFIRFCDGQGVGIQRTDTKTLSVTPDQDGRAVGAFTIESNTGGVMCGCGCGTGTLTVTYEQMTLTNLATGRTYRLDPVTQTFTT